MRWLCVQFPETQQTEITRPNYERDGLRYASDPSDGDWDLIAPFMPPAKSLGRPRTTDLRAVEGREASPSAGVIDSQCRKASLEPQLVSARSRHEGAFGVGSED
jgi:hypothetical protein